MSSVQCGSRSCSMSGIKPGGGGGGLSQPARPLSSAPRMQRSSRSPFNSTLAAVRGQHCPRSQTPAPPSLHPPHAASATRGRLEKPCTRHLSGVLTLQARLLAKVGVGRGHPHAAANLAQGGLWQRLGRAVHIALPRTRLARAQLRRCQSPLRRRGGEGRGESGRATQRRWRVGMSGGEDEHSKRTHTHTHAHTMHSHTAQGSCPAS